MKQVILFIGWFLFTQSVCGQTLLNVAVYKHVSVLDYENDLFARTDRYYTQGIQLGYTGIVHSNRRVKIKAGYQNPKLLAISAAVNHKVYTPSTILSDSALVNNRPYAATLSGRFVSHIIDTVDWFSLSLGVELGVVGPAAGGKQMQTGIHKATDNPLPLGWQYQIANGLIADVIIEGEKRFARQFDLFQGVLGMNVRAGTFQVYGRPSLTLMVGNLNSYAYYFYTKSSFTVLAYDGSLSGSLIGGKSLVTVPADQINRLIGEEEIGFRFQTGRVGGSVHYHIQTKTFQMQQGLTHKWAGISLFVRWG